MKTILIAGGAGYIGSHCTLEFQRAGYNCVIVDNLSEGHREAVKDCAFYQTNLSDQNELQKIFKNHKIDAVVHFAASTYVGVSVTNPQEYYHNNVVNTLNLLKVMLKNDVKKIVFSSTCATYGNPVYTPIDEKHPQNPINPYGKTKLMIEQILDDYDHAYGLKYMALRYFNAAGADNEAGIGESHNPETHLIPLVLEAASGKRDSIKIFGTDYDTPDGTCIRDYIHVNDLAKAHRLALEELFNKNTSNFYNLGIGKGYSVKEIIDLCRKITDKDIKSDIAPKREGDPPILVASNDKALSGLNFKPEIPIEEIIKTAWVWEQNRRF